MKVTLYAVLTFLIVGFSTAAQPTVHVAYSETFPKPPYNTAKYMAPDMGRALICHTLKDLPRTCRKFFFPYVFTAYAPMDATDTNLVQAISIEADKTGVYAVLLDEDPPEWAAKYLPTELPALDSTGYVSRRGYGIVCIPGAGGGGIIREQ